ncbi:hypothetical protein QWZ10_25105 [Paracoccus cavernae]|uniref:Tetratricopeptide repeat protein n=1 Tax=Paracoccus cavernae TaxID=1571207 RepID=A0ABT8DDF3_9RHOB|nr:hypothetical protein [Paracoccus cavernae]
MCLEDLLRIYPRHGKIWYGLSLSHRLAGNYDDSISFAIRSLRFNPAISPLWAGGWTPPCG